MTHLEAAILVIGCFAYVPDTAHGQTTTPAPSLQRLVGTWRDSTGVTLTASLIANGRGVQTVFVAAGAPDTAYRADALWAIDRTSNQVRSFEVNSAGAVLTHVGRFLSPDSLLMQRFAADSGSRLVQRSLLVWTGRDLQVLITAIQANGREVIQRSVFHRLPSP